MATPKQVSLCLSLLRECGFETKWMNSSYKSLGAGMKERSGTVAGWLESKSNAEVSALIEDLQERIAKSEHKAKLEIEMNTPDETKAELHLSSPINEEIRLINGEAFAIIGNIKYNEQQLSDLLKRLRKIAKVNRPKELATT